MQKCQKKNKNVAKEKNGKKLNLNGSVFSYGCSFISSDGETSNLRQTTNDKLEGLRKEQLIAYNEVLLQNQSAG